jgi:hypothetical protein
MGGQVAEAGLTVNRSLNTVAQSGVHLGQNLGLYEESVLKARMSLPEFENTIRNNARSLAGLSTNMDKSALMFLAVGSKVQDTEVAYQLKATGTSTEEFGQVLAMVAHNARQDDMTRASSQKSLIATTLSLTTEFDNTARLTGISRQEQQKALDAQLKSKDMQLSMMAMDKEERESVTKSLASTKKYGDAVSEAVKIYATGGVTNAEEQKTIMAAGPLAQFAEQLANIKGNTPEDEKRRESIMKKMDEVAITMANTTSEEKRMWAVQAKAGNDTTKAMAGGVLEISRYGQILKQADNAAAREGKTRDQYIAAELEKVKQEREGAASGTGGPEGNAAKLGQTLNKVDTLFKDVTAGAGKWFSGLNDKAGQLITNFGNLNTVLRRYTPDQLTNLPGKIVDNVKANTGVREGKLAPEKGRADGSFGAMGKLIEDFGSGTEMMLHGKEGVITEKQLQGIVGASKQMGANIERKMSSLDSMMLTGGPASQADQEKLIRSMQGTFEKELPKMQKNFEPMMKQFSSSAQTIGKQMETHMRPMVNSMQGSLKSDLERAKAQMPTTNTFEKMFDQFKLPTTVPDAPKDTQSSSDFISQTQSNDAMTEMAKGVNELNKRIERLISAVEDGHNKSVKAIKNTSNLIA